jgi:hypothetical protein
MDHDINGFHIRAIFGFEESPSDGVTELGL